MLHPPLSSRRFRFSAFALFVLACSLFLSLGEWLDLGLRGQLRGLNATDSWQVFLACSALGLLVFFPLGLLVGLWSVTLGPRLSLGTRLKHTLLDVLSVQDRERTLARSAAFLAGLFSAGAFSAAVYVAAFEAKSKLHAAPLPIAITIAVAALGVAVAALLLYRLLLWLLLPALAALLRKRPKLLRLISPRSIAALLALAALLSLPELLSHIPPSWQAFDLRLPCILGVWLLLFPLGLWLAESRLAGALLGWRHFVPVFWATAILLFGLSQFLCALILDANMEVRERITGGTAFSRAVMQSAQQLVDFDNDGVSPLYGGGDCNDFDPNVYPGADEIPDNGIDDNCLAGDYKTASQKKQDAAQTFKRDADLPSVKHVFVLLVGGLRADMMSVNGFSRATTPSLSRFSGQAQGTVNFQFAYAPSSQPYYSLAAMLFARRPSQLSFAPNTQNAPRLVESERSIASVLSSRGFDTPAFLAAQDYDPATLALLRGFYVQENREDSGATPTDSLIRYLGKRNTKGQPIFALAHYGDLLAQGKPDKPFARFGDTPTADYLGNIAAFDAAIGRLLDWLAAQGWLNNSAVLFASTNGALLDTGKTPIVAPSLSQAMIRVPFLLYAPKANPRRISQPVTLTNMAVTLYDLLNQPTTDQTTGSSYLPFLDSGAIPATPVISERLPDSASPRRLTALLHGDYKLLYSHDSRAYQLFDLKNDAKEENNLFLRNPKLSAALLPILQQLEEQASVERGKRYAAFLAFKAPSDLHPLDIHFERGLDLAGYTINKDCFKRGEMLHVTLYWKAREKLSISPATRVFVHIEAKDDHGEVHRIGADHEAVGGQYPFKDWRVGTLVPDTFFAGLPNDWPYGPAKIWLGLYEREGFSSDLGEIPLEKDGVRVAAISFKSSLDGQGACGNLPTLANLTRKFLPKHLAWIVDGPGERPFLILDLQERLPKKKAVLWGPRSTTPSFRLNRVNTFDR